jgi:hypothetical protein
MLNINTLECNNAFEKAIFNRLITFTGSLIAAAF